MLHKQPIKAKITSVTVFFSLPTGSDMMKYDRYRRSLKNSFFLKSYVDFVNIKVVISPLWIFLLSLFLTLFFFYDFNFNPEPLRQAGRQTGSDRQTEAGLSSHLKNHSLEWKKVRDGSRNINAYAESNLSSVRDIRSFFDTEGWRLVGGGGGAGPPGEWRLFPKMPSASCII